jgi:hypothetical protein
LGTIESTQTLHFHYSELWEVPLICEVLVHGLVQIGRVAICHLQAAQKRY